MTDRGARRVHVLLMGWLTFTFVAAWLPFVRGAMDGPSYQWGASHFGWDFAGAGIGGDYWFAAAKAALALLLLSAGWRRPNGPFRIALLLWLMLRFADTLHAAIFSPGDFRFQGDTLGVDVSLAPVAPALDAAMLLAAFWWFMQAPAIRVPPLGRLNVVLLAIFALLLPVQYWLLSAARARTPTTSSACCSPWPAGLLFSVGLGRRRPAGREAIPRANGVRLRHGRRGAARRLHRQVRPRGRGADPRPLRAAEGAAAGRGDHGLGQLQRARDRLRRRREAEAGGALARRLPEAAPASASSGAGTCRIRTACSRAAATRSASCRCPTSGYSTIPESTR